MKAQKASSTKKERERERLRRDRNNNNNIGAVRHAKYDALHVLYSFKLFLFFIYFSFLLLLFDRKICCLFLVISYLQTIENKFPTKFVFVLRLANDYAGERTAKRPPRSFVFWVAFFFFFSSKYMKMSDLLRAPAADDEACRRRCCVLIISALLFFFFPWLSLSRVRPSIAQYSSIEDDIH